MEPKAIKGNQKKSIKDTNFERFCLATQFVVIPAMNYSWTILCPLNRVMNRDESRFIIDD